MPRTDIGAAANARIVPVVEYGVDPRGLGLFRGLTAALHRAVNGSDGTRVLERTAEWNGYAAAPQTFRGMAPLGNSRPVASRTSELSDERSTSPTNNAALQLFADRLRRQR